MTTKKSILTKLAAYGVVRVSGDYSGGGDEGQVQEVKAYGTDDIEIDISLPQPGREVPDAVATKLLNEPNKTLNDLVEQFIYDTLDKLNVEDWVNNEGGGGEFTIYVVAADEFEAGHIEIDHYYNEVEQHHVPYSA